MTREGLAANKEVIVTEIIALITGYILCGDCLQLITKKYSISERTFAIYWKLANERVIQAQHATQITIIGKHTKAQIERAEEAIFSRKECLEQLTKIARSPDNLKNKPMVVISAISKICEIEGYNKAIEVAGTIDVPIISWANDNA